MHQVLLCDEQSGADATPQTPPLSEAVYEDKQRQTDVRDKSVDNFTDVSCRVFSLLHLVI